MLPLPVTVPPRSAETGSAEPRDDRDLAQRVADLEALFEEARRRARRRRRLYAAGLLAAAAAAAAALFGGGGSRPGSFGSTVGGDAHASAAVRPAPGRWAPTHGPDGGGLSLVVDPTSPEILYAGGWGSVFKSTDGGGSWHDVTSGSWSRVGALALDPLRHRVVYAGTDRGVAKTTDGGRTWRMVDSGLVDDLTRNRHGEGVSSLVVDAHHPQTVYAIDDGALFRTVDGGAHWRLLEPAAARALHCPRCAVLVYGYLVAAAIDPHDTQTIYAGWSHESSFDLYRSTDGGDGWQRVQTRSALRPGAFAALAIDAGALYASAGSRPGVLKSSDGGVTWSPAGLATHTPWSLAVDSGTLDASTAAGLFRTSDGGATWQLLGRGANVPGGAVVTDPHDANTMYGIGDGVVKSVDGGRTWAAADRGLASTLVPSLALAPGSSTILYAGGYGGVFRSTDGGLTWRFTSGLGTSPVDTLVVDPDNARTLYAAESRRGGLYTSTDAGGHWRRLPTPFPSNGVRALAVDPRRPRTMYVAAGGTLRLTVDGRTRRPVAGIRGPVQALAIDPRHPSTVFAGTSRGDIFRSTDAGRSWQQVATAAALPASHQYAVVEIVVDPRDSAVVYAARRTSGIVESGDGGQTWRRVNTGLTDTHVDAVAIDPSDPHVLYASTGAPGTTGRAAVFRSADGAHTWHPLTRGLPAVGVTAFAIDPSGRAVFAATAGDGVIRLRPGG